MKVLIEVAFFLCIFAGLSRVGLGAEVYVQDHKTNAILYHQRASEYAALALQSYTLARKSLDAYLSSPQRGLKPAVVVDVDETLLSNAPYEAKLLINNQSYPMGFEEWIHAAVATPVPGALEFLSYAHEAGVKVFYVTNRKTAQKEATKRNLSRYSFPDVSDETVLTRTDTNSKEPRRKAIRQNYDIVLLIGDNLIDLSQQFEMKESDLRLAQVQKSKDRFGTDWIVVPNAIYGEWESVTGDISQLSPAEKREARLKALQPFK